MAASLSLTEFARRLRELGATAEEARRTVEDYQELLDEALARIPVHNPEWTNRNDTDPGITLLQLWAYMSETLLYRSSLIPERIVFIVLTTVPLIARFG